MALTARQRLCCLLPVLFLAAGGGAQQTPALSPATLAGKVFGGTVTPQGVAPGADLPPSSPSPSPSPLESPSPTPSPSPSPPLNPSPSPSPSPPPEYSSPPPVLPSPSPVPSPLIIPSPTPLPVPSPVPVPVPVPSPPVPVPSPVPSPPPSPPPPKPHKSPPGAPTPPPGLGSPPPPSASTKGSSTTVIIAACAGAGGLLALGLLAWCCCRKGKAQGADKEGDAEEGYAYADDGDVAAAEVFKSVQRQSPTKSTRSHQLQAHPVPMALLEPEDVPVSYVGGPLGAAAAASDVVMGGAAAASMSRQSPTKRASSRSAAPEGLPTVEDTPALDDAYMTSIMGALSQQRDLNTAAQSRPQPAAGGAIVPTPSRQRMDVSAYEIDFESLRMGKRIGEGSFGKVYVASWHETPVAVKVLVDETTALDRRANAAALRNMSSPVLEALAEEAGLMAALRHPNIVQFMGMCTLPPCVVTEYCARGSLADVLRAGKQGKPGAAAELTWRRRLSMALDAATGMLHLHARTPPIIHRDLKSPNLLVDVHWRVKVCDFNMSRLVEESTQNSSLAAMNPRWLAPELMAGEAATKASDVFAFGVVLWELLTWDLPWPKDNPWAIVHMVSNGGRLEIPLRWDLPGPDNDTFPGLADYLDLLQRCWAHNPFDRPQFGEVITELRALAAVAPAPRGGMLNPAAGSGGLTAAALQGLSAGEEHFVTEEMLSAGMSISSTAAAADSIDATRSIPQFNTRPDWGSGPPAKEYGRQQ